MESYSLSLMLLVLNIWATHRVAQFRFPRTSQYIFYYVVIWLMPVVGAALSIILTRTRNETAPQNAEEKMFESVVDKYYDSKISASDPR